MAINVTVRDIVNFPGGTPKTITLDIAQIIPSGGNPEGDEIWVTSSTTTATASGGGAIQDIFKNEMKRGYLRGVPPATALIDIGATNRFALAIDEAIGNAVDIEVSAGTNLLPTDVAQDIENQIRNQAEIGQGGAKEGNLSYLNAQVRFVNGVFQIESGTVTDRFTGPGRSSVAIAAPSLGTDVRETLGLHLTVSSEQLASRQLAETALASDYSSGDLLEVVSTAGFNAGETLEIRDTNNQQLVLISGAGVGDGLSASEIRFVVVSGASLGLANAYSTGAQIRKYHPIDGPDPVSAISTVDQLYRFQIDSMVNQVDFSS
jgi:hypothetical protein